MQKVIILGKSDATISMILDNLESNKIYPKILIINNLSLKIEKIFSNPAFQIEISTEFNELQLYENYFLGVAQSKAKQTVAKLFNFNINQFTNLIHASASISKTTKIGNGCLINSHVSIAAHTEIGNFVTVNRNASIGHHAIVSDFVTINPGANIAGNVYIDTSVQIGLGANILDGISIGKNSIIGAGALVNKDIPSNVVAYGIPAKIMDKN